MADMDATKGRRAAHKARNGELRPTTSQPSAPRLASAPKLFQKILCPVDFDDGSASALDSAIRLARENQAKIYLIHVVPLPLGAGRIAPISLEPYRAQHDAAMERLQAIAKEKLEGKLNYEIVLRSGDPAENIIEAEDEIGADIVVMATHGRTGVSHFFLGSVAERVVRESSKPVLTLRPPRKSP
jgi:universal stress protein A